MKNNGKTGIIIAGLIIGAIASLLVYFGNPANMGFCIACFLRDTAGVAEVTLLYGVLPKLDIITRSVLVRNISENEIRIDKMYSRL